MCIFAQICHILVLNFPNAPILDAGLDLNLRDTTHASGIPPEEFATHFCNEWHEVHELIARIPTAKTKREDSFHISNSLPFLINSFFSTNSIPAGELSKIRFHSVTTVLE
jgi:hypothetical protein